jgi:ABC-2 type transport system permease protein
MTEAMRNAAPSPDPKSPNRHLSLNAQRTSGLPGTVLGQIRAEFLQNLRVPEFLVGTIAIPVILYFMFGLPSAGETYPGGTRAGTLLMVSFSAYGLVTLAIFTFGVDIAREREHGWLRLMRATPLPAWVYFAGKFVMAMLFAALLLLVMFAAGFLLAGVRLPLERWLALFFVLLAGALSFSTLGFALGYLARPKAAATIANLIFLPLSFASGFFFPLNQLPHFLQQLAPYLPTFHYGQLAWRVVGNPADVSRFTGRETGDPLTHILWLAGCFVVFAALALLAYRRSQREAT